MLYVTFSYSDTQCHYTEHHYTERRYTECRYAECCYTKCRGAEGIGDRLCKRIGAVRRNGWHKK